MKKIKKNALLGISAAAVCMSLSGCSSPGFKDGKDVKTLVEKLKSGYHTLIISDTLSDKEDLGNNIDHQPHSDNKVYIEPLTEIIETEFFFEPDCEPIQLLYGPPPFSYEAPVSSPDTEKLSEPVREKQEGKVIETEPSTEASTQSFSDQERSESEPKADEPETEAVTEN